jgi:hypothetical protein
MGENMLITHDFPTRSNVMYALTNHRSREKDEEGTFAILSLIAITGTCGNRLLEISHMRVKTKLLLLRLPTRLRICRGSVWYVRQRSHSSRSTVPSDQNTRRYLEIGLRILKSTTELTLSLQYIFQHEIRDFRTGEYLDPGFLGCDNV